MIIKHKSLEYKELYAEKLAEYWIDEKDNGLIPSEFIEMSKDYQKDVLIHEIISLLYNLPEESANKIKELYFRLKLDSCSFQRLKNRHWNIKAQGIHELASLDARNEVIFIEDFINDKHPVLRHEAISALVRLRPEDPFSFLDKLKGNFTKWDQINVIAIIKKFQIVLPDFSRWFDAENPSVVLLAVEMIKHYKQTDNIEKLGKLLKYPNEEVRLSVIHTIGELKLNRLADQLFEIFDDEPEYVKLLIIQAVGKLDDVLVLNFLSDVVLLNKVMKVRLEAAHALVKIGSAGIIRLETLLMNEDSDIRYIYEQII